MPELEAATFHALAPVVDVPALYTPAPYPNPWILFDSSFSSKNATDTAVPPPVAVPVAVVLALKVNLFILVTLVTV